MNVETALKNIREQYDALPVEQQEQVTNSAKLVEAEHQMIILKEEQQQSAQQELEKLNDTIRNLNVCILDLTEKSQIQALREQYNVLTTEEKKKITAYANLEAAEQRIEALLRAVTAVEDLINAINPLENPALIAVARANYELLTPAQQQRITAYDKLQVAVKKMAILQMDAVLTVPTMTNMTKTLKGKATPKAKIYIYIGGKRLGSATVSEAGNYKVVIPRQKKDAVIKYIVKYDGEELLRKTVKVKAASVKVASAVKATSKTVTGKAANNTTIKIYKGTKRLKTVKTTAKGTFKATIATQKKGTKLKVYVYDVAGNRSAVKTVVVK